MNFDKFKKEREFYENHLSEWLKEHRNNFVLIKGTQLAGFYLTFEEAFNAGISKFGSEEDFFIEEVLEHRPTNFIYIANYALTR